MVNYFKKINLIKWRLYLYAKDKMFSVFYKSSRKFINEYALYAPNTGGSLLGLEQEIAGLTRTSILQVPIFLSELQFKLESSNPIIIKTAEDFCNSYPDGYKSAERFKYTFDKYKSDKTLNHNYHLVYGPLIYSMSSVNTVFEIGLGTVNTDVVSNMGKNWIPGSSLRAFREILPNALIYGADIDKRILFTESRIKTYFVDQTDLKSFDLIDKEIDSIDIFIDDGLHSPNANIASLIFAIEKISLGGWIIIEDISFDALPIWKVIAKLFSQSFFEVQIITCKNSLIFAVKK